MTFFFFSHRPRSFDFPFLFRMFTMLNVVYHHFLTRKTQFFTLFMLSRTSNNTASQNIGGDQCMGRPPHLEFWGDRPPSPPHRPTPGDEETLFTNLQTLVGSVFILDEWR